MHETPPGRPLLVLIPAFNEEKRIARVIAGVRSVSPGAEVLVVDDGSADGTARAARRAGAVVLRHPINLGYGCALQTGYRYALGTGRRFLVQMDGDGQHAPEGIPALLRAVRDEGFDVAVGSRFLGGDSYPVPFARRVGMRVFAWIAGRLTGRRVTDPTSGFQAVGPRALSLFSTDTFPADYPDADVLVMAARAGLTFTEVPVVMRPGPPDKSMHAGVLGPLYYVFKMTLSLFVTLLRRP